MKGKKGFIWLKNGHFSIPDGLEPSDCLPGRANLAAFGMNVKDLCLTGPLR